jgi:hypothetical protein
MGYFIVLNKATSGDLIYNRGGVHSSSLVCMSRGLVRRILEKLGHVQGMCTTIYCDSSSTIKLSKNPILHGRSKHINVRFYFLLELTRDGIVELVHCSTQEHVSNIMTKPLKLEVFLKLGDKLDMCVMS